MALEEPSLDGADEDLRHSDETLLISKKIVEIELMDEWSCVRGADGSHRSAWVYFNDTFDIHMAEQSRLFWSKVAKHGESESRFFVG